MADERTLPEVILAQARRTPQAVAVRQWSTVLTYRELVSRAAAIAGELAGLGAGRETRVGLCAGREPDTVAALLGIWFAGAAYLPIDLANPGPRGRNLLSDAGADVVVADAAGRARLGEGASATWTRAGRGTAAVNPEAIRARFAGPENLAYVMYTSGSSGQPKGVLTTHQNLADWVAGCRGWAAGIGPEMRALALHSLAFDASCYDLLVPLAHGGSIQLVDEEDRADPARLQRFIAEHQVTWAASPPGIAALLEPSEVPTLQALIVGGEVVPPQLVAKWTAGTGCRFYQAYGPTEATVVQVATELRGQWRTPLPLGAALPGSGCTCWTRTRRRSAPAGRASCASPAPAPPAATCAARASPPSASSRSRTRRFPVPGCTARATSCAGCRTAGCASWAAATARPRCAGSGWRWARWRPPCASTRAWGTWPSSRRRCGRTPSWSGSSSPRGAR